MTQRWAGAAAAAAGLIALACGFVPVVPKQLAGAVPSPSPAVPEEARDLDAVCEDGTGFGGLPAYVPGKGKPHKAVLVTKDGKHWLAYSLNGLPPKVFVADEADPKDVDTVVCSERVNAVPAGKTCEMTEQGKVVKVTLYNTAYRVRVREARTGKVLLEQLITATSRECPFASFSHSEEDRYKHFTEPDGEQIARAVKPVTEP
jgi:hypothetical protein